MNDWLFRFCSFAVLPGWVLLLAAPRWKWTERIAMMTLPMVLALVYLWLYIAGFEGFHASPDSLNAVSYLFHSPGLALAGWIHIAALDLFTGAWMVKDAEARGILHLAVIPCLVLTYLFGPVGLLIYFPLRTGLSKGTSE